MDRHYVRVQGDVYCTWRGEPPVYRVYVGEELFAERTFVWRNCFLTETLHLQVTNGKYALRFELLGDQAELKVENLQVTQGPAWIKSGWLLKVGSANPKE